MLEQILKESYIDLALQAETKEEAIEAMAGLLQRDGAVSDGDVFVDCVLQRERSSSTGIGFGVAIPHGKSDAVREPALAFAKLKGPVDWDSLDGKPVEMVFLIAVPEAAAGNEHLQILAQLSRRLMHEDFRNRLLEAEEKEEVFAAIRE